MLTIYNVLIYEVGVLFAASLAAERKFDIVYNRLFKVRVSSLFHFLIPLRRSVVVLSSGVVRVALHPVRSSYL